MQGIPSITPGQLPVNVPVSGAVTIPLAIGEVVRGEVVNILPDAVSMRIKKEVLLAKTDLPLQKGGAYLFRVESLSEQGVQLKIVQALTEETEAVGRSLLEGLNRSEGAHLTQDQINAFRKIIEQLPESIQKQLLEGTAFERLFKGIDTIANGSFKSAIDATGVFFEAKLRGWVLHLMEQLGAATKNVPQDEVAQIVKDDLKGTLLKLKQALSDTNIIHEMREHHVRLHEVEEAVDKLLSHIERQQFESKFNNVLETFLPFVWKELKDGKMLFQESYHPQEGGAEYACVIHLDLEKAGKLITHVRLFADRLHLRFITDNDRFSRLIEANKPVLLSSLADLGIVCNSLLVEKEKEIDIEATVLEKELDIKA